MHIDGKRTENTLRIRLIGELDHHHAPQTRDQLDAMIGNDHIQKLVINLSGLTFMDSSGIGVLLGRYKLAKARGIEMALEDPSAGVERILRMAGLYNIMQRINTREGQ